MTDAIYALSGRRVTVTLRDTDGANLSGVVSVEYYNPEDAFAHPVVILDDGASIHRIRPHDILIVTNHRSKP